MKKRPEFVAIGKIVNAHGIGGDVVIEPMTDDLEQFSSIKQVYLCLTQESRQLLAIERTRSTANKILLKFAGINDRNAALDLKGLVIEKRLADCPMLPADSYYIFDIIGLNVRTVDDRWVGEISDVMTLPANDVYIVNDGQQEYLIPAIKAVIKKIDLDTGLVIIDPLEGLLSNTDSSD
ncbi:MAG: ribosome maturation factor RimM [candidate division KSB1 bacterium]|nr:ribosome maturation factor RimM [candidate division KSB1 bacterium]